MESPTKEEHLVCPACGIGPLSRLGDLMNHIEKDCARLSVAKLDEIRDEKLRFTTQLQALTQAPIKHDYSAFVKGQEPAPQQLWSDEECDRLLALKSPGVKAANGDGWASTSNKENAKPTTPLVFHGLDPDHPHHPAFDATRYYLACSERYHCPKPLCQKAFPRAKGLIGHLLSSAHSNRSYRCPYCLSSFKSLTAIASHAEAAGIKCRLRETDRFEAYIDQLTAGLVDVMKERDGEGNPKYRVTKRAQELFGQQGLVVEGGNGWK